MTSFGQWTWSTLPLCAPKINILAENIGDTLYFAYGQNIKRDTIEVYDANTNSWLPKIAPTHLWQANSCHPLPNTRPFGSSTTLDNKVYFGGGMYTELSTDLDIVTVYDRSIDSLYALNGGLSTDSMYVMNTGLDSCNHIRQENLGRYFLSSTHAGDKIFFAGGLWFWFGPNYSYLIDIYNTTTGTWSTHNMASRRALIGAGTDGNVAIFAGGTTSGLAGNISAATTGTVTDEVDIYNSSTDTWSTATLSEARAEAAVVYHNGKFYIAGGHKAGAYNVTGTVDVYDVATNTWSTIAPMPHPRGDARVAVVGDNLFFCGGEDVDLSTFQIGYAYNNVDIYNTVTNTWTSITMPVSLVNMAVVASADRVFIAGGGIGGAGNSDKIYVLSSSSVGVNDVSDNSKTISIYPNPSNGNFTIKGYEKQKNECLMEIYNVIGEKVFSMLSDDAQTEVDLSSQPNGVYFLNINKLCEQKLVIQK